MVHIKPCSVEDTEMFSTDSTVGYCMPVQHKDKFLIAIRLLGWVATQIHQANNNCNSCLSQVTLKEDLSENPKLHVQLHLLHQTVTHFGPVQNSVTVEKIR